jgi:serine/threonine-protein kinase
MNSDDWQRIKDIYQRAMDVDEGERPAFIAAASGGDSDIAREVLDLLAVPAGNAAAIDDIVDTAAAAFGRELPSGERVGTYRLLEVIGQGGMGSVYLAERADDEFNQRVAIKMVNWLIASPALVERFRLERQILASLEHPNIARMLDGGSTAAGVPYLVMEYVDGLSILDYGQSKSLSIDARLKLFLKICDPVQYAHGKLVVHRDIKPSNVLVTADGTPKLLDFGIAKFLDADGGNALTHADARVLTPEYASPEQLLGMPVTTATDVYGLGLMLYQFLSGTMPFELSSKTSPEIRELICHTEPAAPSKAAMTAGHREIATRLTGDLDNIVLKALRKEPERRYETVRDLANDVRNHLHKLPVSARTPSWRYRAGRFVARNRTAVGAAVAAVTVAIAMTAYYTMRIAEERDNALEERRVAESTTDFLVELFNVSDPGESSGASITAREVLDQGAVKIRDELKEDEAIRARMLQTIGRVYERLGLYDEAQALMQEAVSLNRKVLAPGDRMFIDSLDELAWLHYRRENWPLALATAKEALDLQVAAAGGDDATMARTLNHLGTITYYLDDYESSLNYYGRARAALDTPEWEFSDVRSTTLNHLGIVYATLSRFEEAEAVYNESLEIRLKVLGENHPDTATAYANLGGFYSNIREFDKAQEYALKGLDIDRATKGNEHVDVAYDLTLLGNIELERDEPVAALPFLLEAAGIWRIAAGPTHSRYASALDLLSDTYRKLKQFPEAEKHGQESLKILLEHYGPEHTLTADPYYTLGKVYFDSNDLEKAELTLVSALDIRVKAFGETHLAVWNVMHVLAKVELAQGDAGAALERTEKTLGLIESADLKDLPIYGWLQELKARCVEEVARS